MRIETSNNPIEALQQQLLTVINEHRGHTLIYLAGGSALRIFDNLQINPDTLVRTIWCMGDDRQERGESNNYEQLQQRWSQSAEATIIDTSVHDDEDHVPYVERINFQLAEILHSKSDVQTIAILGTGADGHTASIFPMDEESFRETYEVDSTYVPVHVATLTEPQRASLTPHAILNDVDQVYGYIAGEAKKSILNKLMNQDLEIYEMPAQLLKLHKNTTVFTDIET